jgi:hypothetical protein
MTWAEVEERLGALGWVVVASEKRASVVEHRSEAGTVRLRLERVAAFGAPWLLFLVPIAAESRARFRDALIFNARLAIGTLAIEQGWLMLRATHAMAELDRGSFDQHVDFLAREGLRLRHLAAEPFLAAQAMELFGE